MLHEGWMKMTHRLPKMDESVSLTLTLFPTPLGGFSPSLGGLTSHFSFFIFLRWLLYSNIIISNKCVHFHYHFFIAHVLFHVGVFVICMLPLPYSYKWSFFIFLFFIFFAIFLWDHYDVAFIPTSIFDYSKLSLIVQWETIWGTKANNWPSCPNKGIREEKS